MCNDNSGSWIFGQYRSCNKSLQAAADLEYRVRVLRNNKDAYKLYHKKEN